MSDPVADILRRIYSGDRPSDIAEELVTTGTPERLLLSDAEALLELPEGLANLLEEHGAWPSGGFDGTDEEPTCSVEELIAWMALPGWELAWREIVRGLEDMQTVTWSIGSLADDAGPPTPAKEKADIRTGESPDLTDITWFPSKKVH